MNDHFIIIAISNLTTTCSLCMTLLKEIYLTISSHLLRKLITLKHNNDENITELFYLNIAAGIHQAMGVDSREE
jgi:hypothetical protein